jgi:hypothetical protein
MKVKEYEIPDEVFFEARQILIDKAKENGIIYYSDLSKKIKSDIIPHHSPKMGQLLGAISTYEAINNRPLLSVLVITAQGDKIAPSTGFEPIARKFAKFDDIDSFCVNEIKRTWNYWRNN